MKNKKLKLSELKVKSFVTNEDEINKETIKGGITTNPTKLTQCFVCPPDPTAQTICFVCGTFPVILCPADK